MEEQARGRPQTPRLRRMATVKMIMNAIVAQGRIANDGEIINVPDLVARILIAKGNAIAWSEVKESSVDLETQIPDVETRDPKYSDG